MGLCLYDFLVDDASKNKTPAWIDVQKALSNPNTAIAAMYEASTGERKCKKKHFKTYLALKKAEPNAAEKLASKSIAAGKIVGFFDVYYELFEVLQHREQLQQKEQEAAQNNVQ